MTKFSKSHLQVTCKKSSMTWALVFLGLTPGITLADADESFNFAAGILTRYEDNLFRLASDAPAPNTGGASAKSDTVLTTYAGIRFDRAYDLQRLQLDLTATAYNYLHNDFLNFTALDYRAAWLWAVSPRLTGSLLADSTSTATSYTNIQSIATPNERTIRNQGFTGDWWIEGGWHLTAGVLRLRSITNSTELTSFGNFVQNSLEAGIKYLSTANNSIALVQRQSSGEYLDRTIDPVNLLDTHYDQRDTELRSIYQLSTLSQLDARIGYRDRSYENYSVRNYSGGVGAINYIWRPTSHLQFTLAAGRDLLAYQEASNSYYISNYVGFTPAWIISEKTTLRLKFELYKNKFQEAVVPIQALREDQINATQLGLSWQPTRTVTVDSYLLHENRSSNFTGLPFKANVASISVSALF